MEEGRSGMGVKMMSLLKLLFVLVLLLMPVMAHAEVNLDAKVLFKKYISRQSSFDPSVTELYSESAVIKNVSIGPDGKPNEIIIPFKQYKDLIESTMEHEKAIGDVITYADTNFEDQDEGVHVTANRVSVLKKTVSPVSFILLPDRAGQWLIYEEVTQEQ
jgi:hypothetical protein